MSATEQARLLRRVAEEIERGGETLPAEVLAPIASLAAHRLERLRGRAQQAIAAMRAHAAERGLDKLTEEDVEAEIAAARLQLRAGRDPT